LLEKRQKIGHNGRFLAKNRRMSQFRRGNSVAPIQYRFYNSPGSPCVPVAERNAAAAASEFMLHGAETSL